MNELIDEVLFLSELETGREVVSLGTTKVQPVVDEVFEQLADRAARANVTLEAAVGSDFELPLRPRLLRVLVENLAANAISYAGDGASFRLTGARAGGRAPTTATASHRRTYRASSSASSAAIAPVPRAGPVLASRSSNTSSPRPAAPCRRATRRAAAW